MWSSQGYVYEPQGARQPHQVHCRFVTSVRSGNPEVQSQSTNENTVHQVVLPFKDQKSADAVKKQLSDLSNKIDHTLQLVFKNRKICEDLKMREPKPPIISQQCVVYNYKCDLCDAEYVGYTSRHFDINVLTNTVIQQSAST